MKQRLLIQPLLFLFSLLALFLLPALACNLPPRQGDGLSFPTSPPLPQVTLTLLPFPTPSPAAGEPLPVEATATLPAPPPPGAPVGPFWGLQTATPGPGQPGEWATPEPGMALPPFIYLTQPGDTLIALAARFGVSPDQISPAQPMTDLLAPGQTLSIPNLLGELPYPSALLPDSLVVYSPAVAGFSTEAYIAQAGGFLSNYSELVERGERLSGTEIVRRIAVENSVNPQILLAFLEFRSGWVRGQPADPAQIDYPIGFYVPDYTGLNLELSLVAKQLNMGYYGWRQGTQVELIFPSGTHLRLSPGLNAGSAALANLTSKFYRQQGDWLNALYAADGLLALYTEMFGDPWQRAAAVEPLFPLGLTQPLLELPFLPGEDWSLTAGPHIAWRTGSPRGALDFAPITGEPHCAVSTAWVTASATGLVVRAERGAVALDLDGDGQEQTGWVLVYMHLAEQGRVFPGTWVEMDTPLGHPSCEGGQATGTHVHLARKYNGEWLAADGPLPMMLSGWTAHAGERLYEGTLERNGQIVTARPDGSRGSTIVR